MTEVELLDGCDVDIERIEEEAAVRRIRAAGTVRPVIELRVQRIEPDPGAAKICNDFHEIGEVAEIAVAPVAVRPDPVKLHREHPVPSPVALVGGLDLWRCFLEGNWLVPAG